jgi:hypothetical protein
MYYQHFVVLYINVYDMKALVFVFMQFVYGYIINLLVLLYKSKCLCSCT